MEFPNKGPVPQQPTPTPEKKLSPVISGATVASRPATRRVLDFVFAESPRALGAKIGKDVIVPRLKAGLEEAANSFLAGMLWGNGGRPLSNLVQGTVLRGGNTQYHTIGNQPVVPITQTQHVSGPYKDVVCGTQQQAETLLANMFDLFNQFRVVAVGDLYELAGIPPGPSDNGFGWTSLEGARITKTRDGYCLEMPRPRSI